MGIFDIFSTSDQQNAANLEQQYLTQGYQQLSDLFGQGRGAITQYGQAALQPWQQQYGATTAGQTQLGNLLGFGPQGGAGMQSTLANIPGYQFALNQGTQNVLRNQEASGQAASGATLKALQDVGQGTASQNYFNYVNALQPQLGAANTAAGGIAGTNMGIGTGLNANLINQGNAAYGTMAGIGNAQAQAQLAGLTQSGNIIGGLGGIASLALLSDERAKTDIEPVGKTYDGQTISRFRYNGDPTTRMGLMAQDVERRSPQSVVTTPGGLKGVNYKTALDNAAALGARAKGTSKSDVARRTARASGRPDYAALLTARRA